MIFQVPSSQPDIQPETLFHIGSLLVTNAMIMGVLVTVIFALMAFLSTRKAKLVPTKFQVVIEMAFEGFQNLIAQITGNVRAAQALLPLIGAIFLYIGISNIIALIPGLTSITFDGIPIFRTPTNDFNTTFSIALGVIILTQIMSLRKFGFFGHLAKYFKFKEVYLGFKEGIVAGFLAIIEFLIGLLDIVSEVAKVVSLSLRLFGNMYAGEVLAAILLGAFAAVVPAPWLAMNLLVGILQALVFGALSTAYYALALETASEEEQAII